MKADDILPETERYAVFLIAAAVQSCFALAKEWFLSPTEMVCPAIKIPGIARLDLSVFS